MRSRARAGSHWRPFPRTRPRAARASGLGSEGRWDGVRERWRSQLHPHRARTRACGGLRERGEVVRGGGVVSSLFLFSILCSCGAPRAGIPTTAPSRRWSKSTGGSPHHQNFIRVQRETKSPVKARLGRDGRNVRAHRRAVGLWFVVVLVSDLIFRVVRACVCVGSLRAVDSAGAFERATAGRAATRAAAYAAPERASVAGTRARDARAWVGGGG